jgi:hypothetical protein
MLLGGTTVYVRFIAGPPVTAVAPIFSIFDDQQREVLLLGADRADGVFRYRMRGGGILDQPDLRLRGAMRALAPGDSSRMVVWRRGRAFCMTVGTQQSCNLGFTVGRTWGLLLYGERLGATTLRLIDAAWIALLFLPAALWWRSRRALRVITAISIGGLAVIPLVTGILHTSVIEYAAAFAGILAGRYLGDVVANRSARSARQGSTETSSSRQRSIRS